MSTKASPLCQDLCTTIPVSCPGWAVSLPPARRLTDGEAKLVKSRAYSLHRHEGHHAAVGRLESSPRGRTQPWQCHLREPPSYSDLRAPPVGTLMATGPGRDSAQLCSGQLRAVAPHPGTEGSPVNELLCQDTHPLLMSPTQTQAKGASGGAAAKHAEEGSRHSGAPSA